MQVSKLFLSIVFLLMLSFPICCKHSTAPPIEPLKDPRTYTWTIYTLEYPGSIQTNMTDVWGSSPRNLYLVGHNDQSAGLMWHFDGTTFTDVRLAASQGGLISGAMDLSSILGFSADDIWAVGVRLYDNSNRPPNFLDSSRILHFDGRWWQESSAAGGRHLEVIRAIGANDIWAAGWYNTLFHYDGVQWTRDSLPISVPADAYFIINVLMPKSSDDVYASGYVKWNYLPNSIYYLFHRQQGSWSIIDSSRVQPGLIEYKWGVGDMWMSPSGSVYSCGAGIFRQNGSEWEWMYDPNYYLYRIAGTSDQNIFVVGDYSTVLHYNGMDWYRFPSFTQGVVVYQGIWTNGREVFIVGYTADTFPSKTIVLHGK